jgi:Uncharacterized Zn-finger containing protein
MRDENIDKISEMLLRGGKMLSRHCPTCNSPLFKFGEEIICPVCGTSFAEVDAKEERKTKISATSQIKDLRDANQRFATSQIKDLRYATSQDLKSRERSPDENEIKRELRKKIGEILEDLKRERDLTKIKMGLECIDKALEILNKC